MEPQNWMLDPVFTAASVVRAVDDIDVRTDKERDALLYDLLEAAWGSIVAQNQ